MMKRHITAKAIREEMRYRKTLAIGYCDLQHLLSCYDAQFYNAGVYGWNFDAYYISAGNELVCITTGYRNTVGRLVNHDIVSMYDEAARVALSAAKTYEERNEISEKLMSAFLHDAFVDAAYI